MGPRRQYGASPPGIHYSAAERSPPPQSPGSPRSEAHPPADEIGAPLGWDSRTPHRHPAGAHTPPDTWPEAQRRPSPASEAFPACPGRGGCSAAGRAAPDRVTPPPPAAPSPRQNNSQGKISPDPPASRGIPGPPPPPGRSSAPGTRAAPHRTIPATGCPRRWGSPFSGSPGRRR